MAGPIAITLDTDGVLVATIDMVDRTMNVFSYELKDALDALIDRAERDTAVRSVVVTSGKASFLAGADLSMVRGFTEQAKTATHDEMFALCGRLGRQFLRIEESAKPWVAAVNGIALGGGLELALACRARLVADDPRIQLGVPEVRWGLLPGAGGTQRLPRLAGREPALDLLLSGRSIDPATAVRLGIFARTVPAPALLDEAKAVARSLHGAPYDPAAKFANLVEADVARWSETVAREAARRHGIDDATFAHYPAYSAIADSVLKGAGLSLAAATDVEMTQFLRLMFSPVAGRMVRTLFLERLRAERELAAPAGVAIERIEHGPIGEVLRSWTAALARTKLPVVADESMAADTLELVGRDGARARVAIGMVGGGATASSATASSPTASSPTASSPTASGPAASAPTASCATADGTAADGAAADGAAPHRMDGAAPHRIIASGPAVVHARGAAALAVLSPTGAYGRVVEVVGGDDAAQALIAALAARLRALAWPTPGPHSVLQSLHGKDLDEQALLALEAAACGYAGDPAFLDTAACLAGVTPAWTGGPLTWAWSERERLKPRLSAGAQSAWTKLEPILAGDFA